ncbi:MAG: hypothetical protein ABI592_07340 [Acidobacteriota bacterium]
MDITFTSEDLIRLTGPPPNTSVLPALFRAAHRNGLIVKYESARASSHWIGSGRGGKKPVERSDSTVRGLRLAPTLWRELEARAAVEGIPIVEIMNRALRGYLDRQFPGSRLEGPSE